MDRREVLEAVAGGALVSLAGCVSGEADPIDEPLADEIESGTPEDGYPALSVDGDEIPADHESALDAAVGVTRQYSADAPARIRIDLVNRRDESRQLAFGPSPPFSQLWGEQADGDARVYLVPENRSHVGIHHVDDEWNPNADPPEPVGGCWQVDGVGTDGLAITRVIPARDVISESYSVFAAADVDGCLPAGEYRFDGGWTADVQSADSVELGWGFTLAVEQTHDGESD